MPTYTVVIILAIAGALCLALMAAARRWPGDGRWSGRRQGHEREDAQQAWIEQMLRERLVSQRSLLHMLRARFGELPPAVMARIESEGPEWCEEMLKRVVTAHSLEELGF